MSALTRVSGVPRQAQMGQAGHCALMSDSLAHVLLVRYVCLQPALCLLLSTDLPSVLTME